MPVRRKRRHTVVITGIGSRLGRRLTRALHGDYRIIGIDPRGAKHMPKDVTVHPIDLRRRRAEDIFRRNQIDAIVHLNPEPEWKGRAIEHRNLAVLGTHRVLDFSQKHDVPKVVLLSSANIYGPSPDNNQFLTEEAPLLAGQRFPTMRDLVEVDMYAQSFFWRHPEIDTVILRPVNIVGRLNNSASRYLQLRSVPTLLGFDPMVQVMAPDDVIHAIRLSLKPGVRGIFNVAGPGPLALSELIRRVGRPRLPVPEGLARFTIGALAGIGASAVPSAEIDYLKYICMVDDHRARQTLGWAPTLTLDQTLEPLRGVTSTNAQPTF